MARIEDVGSNSNAKYMNFTSFAYDTFIKFVEGIFKGLF